MSPPNANIQGTLGLVYQFWVALEKCDELLQGESILIEEEGDVSSEDRFQIELKHFSEDDPLTSGAINIWNTLKNWMDDAFDHTKYRSLILRTTQPHGIRSIFKDWNVEANLENRINILKEWGKARELAFAASVERATQDSIAAPSVPDSLILIRQVLEPSKDDRLRHIAQKFCIEAGAPGLSETVQRLLAKVCRHIPEENQRRYLDALGGFIIRPPETGRWEITFDAFKSQCEELSSIHCRYSRRFPTKYSSRLNSPLTEEQQQLLTSLFVKKIEEIEHHEKTANAIKDYSFAYGLVFDDFKKYSVSGKDYLHFEDRVERDFCDAFSTATRQPNRCPKDFYDEHMSSTPPHFSGYEATPKDFRNGVLHMHMNDENKTHRWKLSA